MALRRGRIDDSYRNHALANLGALRIDPDPDSDRLVWSASVELAEQHRLTVYDACYLELAQRRTLPLATLDGALRHAADSAGVALLGA